MRVARRKFLLFLPDFGATSYFFWGRIVLGGITHSRVTFNSLENRVSAQVSVQSRTESHKKQSNTTQQNGTEMETN